MSRRFLFVCVIVCGLKVSRSSLPVFVPVWLLVVNWTHLMVVLSQIHTHTKTFGFQPDGIKCFSNMLTVVLLAEEQWQNPNESGNTESFFNFCQATELQGKRDSHRFSINTIKLNGRTNHIANVLMEPSSREVWGFQNQSAKLSSDCTMKLCTSKTHPTEQRVQNTQRRTTAAVCSMSENHNPPESCAIKCFLLFYSQQMTEGGFNSQMLLLKTGIVCKKQCLHTEENPSRQHQTEKKRLPTFICLIFIQLLPHFNVIIWTDHY